MSEGRAGDCRYAASDEKNAHEATAPAEPLAHRDYGTYDEDRCVLELAEGESALEAKERKKKEEEDAAPAATGDGVYRSIAAPAATGDGVYRSTCSTSTIILDGAVPLPCVDLGDVVAEVYAENEYMDLGAVASGQVDGDLAAEPGGLASHDPVARKRAALEALVQTVERTRAVQLKALVSSADPDTLAGFELRRRHDGDHPSSPAPSSQPPASQPPAFTPQAHASTNQPVDRGVPRIAWHQRYREWGNGNQWNYYGGGGWQADDTASWAYYDIDARSDDVAGSVGVAASEIPFVAHTKAPPPP